MAVHLVVAASSFQCPDLSGFQPVVQRLAGLLAGVVGLSLLVNVLRGGLTYLHAHGRMEQVAHAKDIFKHTAIGAVIVGVSVPLVAVIAWLAGGLLCG